MKLKYLILLWAVSTMCISCQVLSGGKGVTGTELGTEGVTVDESLAFEVASEGITYTIDVSTEEGRLKLEHLSLKEAQDLALQEAAIVNNAARIISPKFSYLKKGKSILRITVFGFPAKYKNR